MTMTLPVLLVIVSGRESLNIGLAASYSNLTVANVRHQRSLSAGYEGSSNIRNGGALPSYTFVERGFQQRAPLHEPDSREGRLGLRWRNLHSL